MHFFKLFLAATFAVSAAFKGVVTLIDAWYPSAALTQKIVDLGPAVSLAGAALSFLAGMLIAMKLRRRSVPKASHGN